MISTAARECLAQPQGALMMTAMLTIPYSMAC